MKDKIVEIINNRDLSEIKIKDFKQIKNELNIYLENTEYRNIAELIYHVYTNFTKERPKCIICQCNYVNFYDFNRLYGKTCSTSCQAKNAARKNMENVNQLSEEEKKEYYASQQKTRKSVLLEKYGVENPMQIKEVAEKNHKQMRQTNIDSGRWLNFDIIEDKFEKYTKEVEYFTFQQDWKSLPNAERRGHISIEGAYHLDHKFSKKQGFLEGIPPEIIGSIHNLEMIPARENTCVKLEKCSITKEELLGLYHKDTPCNM